MEVSIIIPIYNGSRYIQKAIECLQNQRYKDFEAILVDDGSTDDSFEMCQRYTEEDPRFVILRKQNGGASEARNAGIRIAKGCYICFADVDDIFNEYYIEDLMKCAQQGDLVLQGRVRLSKNKETIIPVQQEGIYDLRKNPESFFSMVDIEKYGAPYCKLFSNEIIHGNKIFFGTNILLAEDFDFLIRYLSVCDRVVIDNKANYSYRDNYGSLSTKAYSFDIEYSGLKQIDGSLCRLMKRFSAPSLQPLYGKSIVYHVQRAIWGNYRGLTTRRVRIENLKNLERDYGSLYQIYSTSETRFLKLVKFLFCNKHFVLMDFVMSRVVK
jgi:glycosyltransferase involved in cell wall biosynthesis